MPRKKKHPPRTSRNTRSKTRDYKSNTIPSQIFEPNLSTTYPDFMASESFQSVSPSSSTPIPSVSDTMNGSKSENGYGKENGGPSLTSKQGNPSSVCADIDLDLSNANNSDMEHEIGTGSSITDNDSLFNTLQSQTTMGISPLKSMLKALLDSFNHQLRLEIKSDMKQLLDENKRELSEFKSQIDTKISNIDCKLNTGLADVNQKIVTLEKLNSILQIK